MSQLTDRVADNVHICGVEIALVGKAIPSINPVWQRLYNSIFEDDDFQKVYAGLSSLQFNEESVNTSAGMYFKQKVTFRFPTTDNLRADRLMFFSKIKFIKLLLTNGLEIVVGRNDFEQNAKPLVEIKTNEQLAEVEVNTSSIFASGYTYSSINGSPMITSSLEHLLLVRQVGDTVPEIRVVSNPSGKTYTPVISSVGAFRLNTNSNFVFTDNRWPEPSNDLFPIYNLGGFENFNVTGKFSYYLEIDHVFLKTGTETEDFANNVLKDWQLIRFIL